MDLENLKTASLYINNQLLSRGLLRNGQHIDFARPEQGEGGMEHTLGRIMGVVNDLILRRDRDATQRETLTNTLRTVKADTLRLTTDHERLSTKNLEAQRKLGISEATTHSLQLQLKTAESKERALREEMARMKELVKQTRNQCAVEVRKRERVVEGLKKHVGDGRVRGGGKNPMVREIVVVGGIGEKEVSTGSGNGVPVGEEGYDLRSETNEFLTELARGLSEENEHLAALARRTLENLRVLSGWEKEGSVNGMVVPMEMGPDELAKDMESVISHIRTLLTNPSFVPLEEVEVREEEIIRLREGWERMESRWREAVVMMDGWRKRMARSGQTVNLEELKMGLKLSPLKPKQEQNGFQLSTLEEEGEGDTQADIDAMDEVAEPDFDELDDSDSSMLDEDEPLYPELGVDVQEEEQEQEASFNTESSAVQSPPQLSPLRETSGNRHATYPPPIQEREKDGFTTIIEENIYDLLQLASSSPKKSTSKTSNSTPQSTTRSRSQQAQTLTTPPEDEVALIQPSSNKARSGSASPNKYQNQAQTQTNSKSTRSNPTPTPAGRQINHSTSTPKLRLGPESRLPRPREQAPPQSPLTMASIAAKLAASEREADAARVRAKIKAARMGRQPSIPSLKSKNNTDKETGSMPPPPSSTIRKVEDEKMEEGVEEERERPRKRKAKDMNSGAGASRREGGRAARRRSTLSPWELESLLLGGAVE